MLKSSVLLAMVVCVEAVVLTASAQAANGWYSKKQADTGHGLFNNHCAECHRPDLTGAMGPALKGPKFLARWGGRPIEDLFRFEHEKMPATNPGSLPSDEILAITAYILEKNGLPAGQSDLTETTAKQNKLPKT